MAGRPRKVALTPIQRVVLGYLVEMGSEDLAQLTNQVHARVLETRLEDVISAIEGLVGLGAVTIDVPPDADFAGLVRHIIWNPAVGWGIWVWSSSLERVPVVRITTTGEALHRS